MFFGTHVPVYPGTWESVLVGCMTVHIVSTNYWGFPWIIDEKLTFARFCSYRSATFAQGLQVIKMFSFNSMKSCKATFVRLVRSFYLWSIQLFACFLTLVQVTCCLSLCKLSTHVLPETVSLILLDLHSFLCSFMFQHFFHFSLSLEEHIMTKASAIFVKKRSSHLTNSSSRKKSILWSGIKKLTTAKDLIL